MLLCARGPGVFARQASRTRGGERAQRSARRWALPRRVLPGRSPTVQARREIPHTAWTPTGRAGIRTCEPWD
jgi:hypothetical protein